MFVPPRTAASIVHPVAAAMACAPVSVSRETRFSFPCCCSTTTRMVSAMRPFSVLRYLPRPEKSLAKNLLRVIVPCPHLSLDHPPSQDEREARDRRKDHPGQDQAMADANVIKANRQKGEQIADPQQKADHHPRSAAIGERCRFLVIV